ncbi:MAG: hypothetical protein QOJ99_2209 [Bryobacterales bacterium]|nr:hypothetical protein [Bryobacterales bacterium]
MVILLHAVPPLPPVYFESGFMYALDIHSPPIPVIMDRRLRKFAAEEFPRMETRCVVLDGEPARVIVDYARDNKADLIALPTHGYGLFRRALLGSVTSKVLHDSTAPVWTSAHCCEAGHRAHPQPRVIVAAVDLKEKTQGALQVGLAVARDTGAAVEVMHLAPEGQTSPDQPKREVELAVATAAFADGIYLERRATHDMQITTEGESIASLVRRVAQQKRADLVVIGRGRIHGHLLDQLHSHAYSVVCESPCPVLSV